MSIYYDYSQGGSRFLSYILLMTLSIGIHLSLLGNGLWILLERYSMWTSWDVHIGSGQSEFIRWRIIPFLGIRLDMLLLFLQNTYILPQLRQVQSFIRTHFHMIWYSQKTIHLSVINKLKSWPGNSTFTSDIALVHWFIYCLQEWTAVF